MLLPTITIRQPWAWLILQDQLQGLRKDIENRSWKLPKKYINTPVLIHTSAKPCFDLGAAHAELFNRLGADKVPHEIPLIDAGCCNHGHIVGAVWFSSSQFNEHYDSPFHHQPERFEQFRISPWCDPDSKHWWRIEKALPITPEPAKGRLGFWQFDYPHPEELEAA